MLKTRIKEQRLIIISGHRVRVGVSSEKNICGGLRAAWLHGLQNSLSQGFLRPKTLHIPPVLHVSVLNESWRTFTQICNHL